MPSTNKIGAVIVAAGSGVRFGERKQFKKLGAKPLYIYSLQQFLKCKLIDEIVIVVPGELLKGISEDIKDLSNKIKIIEGGKLRQDSVFAGINGLSANCNIVCVHDAARPFVSVDIIERTINVCQGQDGAIAAAPSHDTIKEVDASDKHITKTVPRETIWLAQTPQVFHRDKLINAFAYAKNNKIQATDESTLLELLGNSIVVVKSSAENFKITTQNDWQLAELLLEKYND